MFIAHIESNSVELKAEIENSTTIQIGFDSFGYYKVRNNSQKVKIKKISDFNKSKKEREQFDQKMKNKIK